MSPLDADPLRCFHPETSARMVAEVDDTKSSGDTVGGVGSGAPSGTRTGPMESVWLTSVIPSSARNARATAPSATRAAVSRALARSRTGRASSKSYFCMPTRSAWPGRGRVRAAARAPCSFSGSTGSGLMMSTHLGHSVLPMRTAMGLPSVRPWTTPVERLSSSCSTAMRAPRP